MTETSFNSILFSASIVYSSDHFPKKRWQKDPIKQTPNLKQFFKVTSSLTRGSQTKCIIFTLLCKPSLALTQGFSRATLLIFGARKLCMVRALLCIAGCLSASQASTHHMSVITLPSSPSRIVTTKKPPGGRGNHSWLRTTVLTQEHS